MNGSALKYLAGVSDIARLDLEAAAVTIRSERGEMTACYAGAYARGLRRTQTDAQDFSISISAARFKTLASMFSDEEDVLIKPVDNALGMATRSTSTRLQRWGEESEFPSFDRDAVDFAARLPANVLISEIDAAQEFTAESMLRPALTGIRLDFQDRLKISAFDGFGALFESVVKARIKGEGTIIVPTDDFILGAKLVADGDAVVVKPKGQQAVVIYNSKALFRSSLIVSAWPDITAIKETETPIHFKVDASQIRNLAAGAKALESGPDIEVSQQGSRILFSARSEAGAFTTAVKGKLQQPLRYDAATLSKAVKLGPVLDFHAPIRPDSPTRIESEHRRCWIMTRI